MLIKKTRKSIKTKATPGGGLGGLTPPFSQIKVEKKISFNF